MQELRQVGEIAYQTQTKQVLSVSDFRVDVNSYSFVIELKKHEILSVYPDYREVAVFGQLFNRPTARLHLKLNFNNDVLEVLNQDEVNANWQVLKQMDSIAQMQPIIEAGNRAFSNTLPMLKEQWLYQLIFTGLSEAGLLNQWRPAKQEMSNYFKGEWIPVHCKKKSLTNEQGITQFNLLCKNIQSEVLNEEIKDYYRKFAPAFLNDCNHYRYTSRTSYIFNGQSIHASKIVSEIFEELNLDEVFHSKFEVVLTQ